MRASLDAFPPSPRASRLVYCALWFAVIAWGGLIVAARLLLSSTVRGQVALSPTALAAARFSLASLFFVVPLARAVLMWYTAP